MGDTKYYGTTVFNNAVIVYDNLFSKSEVVQAKDLVIYGYPSDGPEARVYFGLATRASEEIGVHKSAHGNAMTLLTAMEAIEKLRTGNHTVPSVYVLNYKPTRDQFDKYKAQSSQTSTRISPSKTDVFKHDLSDARVRIRVLERQNKIDVENISLLTEAVKDLQTQIDEFRDKLGYK